jgi:hypothetical protein
MTIGEGRTLYATMADCTQEMRLLRMAIVELTASIREHHPIGNPRSPFPSSEEIAVDVADRLHRGTDSDRVQRHARNLAKDALWWLFVAALGGVVVWVVLRLMHLA